ncbi:MAG: hypothetical protein NT175_01320 [Bacteroidetes bacterium]|nr:hypothetical protein [Bacteroidota bacterium]
MKKLSYLFAILLLAGTSFMMSCKDTTETPQDLKPNIDFKGGAAYISADATLTTLQEFLIGITASPNTTSGKNLANLKVTRTYNNAVWFEWDTTVNVAYVDIDFSFLALTVAGTERISFVVTDKDGQTNEVALNITTQVVNGPINFFTQKILGSYASSTGSSFASIDGSIYNLADAKANAAKVDWLYFYGGTNHATIAAPDDADAAIVFNDLTNGLSTWSVRNATRLKKITTVVDWAAITDDGTIKQLTADGVTETKIPDLVVGNISGFKTVTGKFGLIKVDNITGTTAGTIEISVKVQQ